MSSHTPGPWQMVQEDKGQNELSRRLHGKKPMYRVESANLGHGFVGYFRRKRDAQLAAAAPELQNIILHLRDALRCKSPEDMVLYLMNQGLSARNIDIFLEKIIHGVDEYGNPY